MINNIENLRTAQLNNSNPGFKIGDFLISHSVVPEYLVSQLEAYLEAAKADLAEQQIMYSFLRRGK
jgi:hypothetical protein